MACTDGGVPFPPTHQEILEQKVPSAMLCALLRTGLLTMKPNPVIDRIDWAEAGITRDEFDEWWRVHQEQDAARKRREERDMLPPGKYVVREEVTFQNRHWFVTAVIVEGGTDVTVAMVTADDKNPVRSERFKVRKA